MEKSKRILELDIARSFAIVFVVLCHSLESIYSLKIDNMENLPMMIKIFVFTVFTIGRMGVPLFLFISGYLLLGKTYNSEICLQFWKKNMFNLLLTTEIWIVFYHIFMLCVYNQPFSKTEFLLNIMMIKNVNMPHMWYMPMIIGVYLFVPLLSNLLNLFDDRIWKIILTVIFVYSFGGTTLGILYKIKTGNTLNVVTPMFICNYYGLYLILGYMVKKSVFDLIKSKYIVFAGTVSLMLAVFIQICSYSRAVEYKVWYNDPFLLVSSFMLFIMINRLHFKFLNEKIFLQISKYAFGIYLTHNCVMILIRKYIQIKGSLPLQTLQLWSITFLISYVIVAICNRSKCIRRYFFLIK